MISLLAFAGFCQSANAQYDAWINSGTGNWSDSSNWGLSTVPTSAMTVGVQNGTAVISSGSATAGQLYVGGGGTGAIQISGPASLQTSGAYAVIGQNGSGSVSLSHAGASWTYNGTMLVGYSGGTGSLSITAGAVQQTGNSGADVIVGGAGGNGILTISGPSASLSTNGGGIYLGSTGDNGHGQMSITAGGQASSGYGWVGSNPGTVGIAEVSGTGSRWNIHDSLWVASSSSAVGHLTLSSGGTVTTGGQVFLGRDGQGSITVTGDGSQLITGTRSSSGERGSIFMAESPGANATLTVADGGVIRASSEAYPSYTRTLYLTGAGSDASSQATLQIGTGGRAGAVDGAIIINGGNGRAEVVFNHSDAAYFFDAKITGSASVTHAGPGTTYLVGGLKDYTGGTTISAGTLGIDGFGTLGTGTVTIGGGTLKTGSGGEAGSRNFVLTSSGSTIEAAQNYTTIISGVISGTGTLNKKGEGILMLSGNNTFSGGTRIEGGTLWIGPNGGGTTGSVLGDIENNAHLEFHRSDNTTFGGVISGTGDLTKWGYGDLTLTSTSTYTGATFIKQGTLTVNGAISGAGGLVTIDGGATLKGSGTINRDILANGTLASSLIITGQVTLANQHAVEVVSSGITTAASGQQLVVTTATGGTVNTTAGTASIGTLDGATVNTGNWGATVTHLTSGTVNTTGGSLVAQQGNFTGTITGSGGLTKTGSGTLTLTSGNNYTGGTIVRDGTLEVAVGTATGSAPIRLVNNGKFRAMGGVNVSTNIISENVTTTYEKDFTNGESLSNFGSFSSNLDGSDTTAWIAQGTAGTATTLAAQFLSSGRLTIDGLDGTTFLLVMDLDMDIPTNPDLSYFFLGWFDPGDSDWKNAVLGNHGADGTLAGGYQSSYESFLSSHGGWDPVTMLGAYGADAETNRVWAVIDHNSEFSAMPEPSTGGLLLLSAATLLFQRRRRD